jgi:hypothetical protein
MALLVLLKWVSNLSINTGFEPDTWSLFCLAIAFSSGIFNFFSAKVASDVSVSSFSILGRLGDFLFDGAGGVSRYSLK